VQLRASQATAFGPAVKLALKGFDESKASLLSMPPSVQLKESATAAKRGMPMSYEFQREIERFLFREARLLDECRYEEWLALFTEDVRYWAPARMTTASPEASVTGEHDLALIDDDKSFLRARIQRLHSGLAHAETPPSRTRRFITNIEVNEESDDEFDVACNMLIYQTRLERTELALVGRREDRLRGSNGAWLISKRKIILDQTLIPRTISIFF
jgi:dibenzofuran dioxygenase subunit beta